MPETTQFGNDEDGQQEGSLKANTILRNRYKVLGIIGGGGQGAVYSGRDMNFEVKRMVAIKEMRYPNENPSVRSTAMATFQREANILATLSHPAIPKIYDFFDQNNRAYLVQEFINGSDLEVLLKKTKELPMDKIIEWSIDLCDVLQYLHVHEPEPIIFRDVKPSNIMVDSLGKVRLIDFGIAKVFKTGVKNTMIGTEGYSAPEQYKGDVNPLSDIYSLGATLHHIITRRDPRLESPFSFSERPIRVFNPTVPEGMQRILDKALDMDPKMRFQSCDEMRAELARLRDGGHRRSVTVEGTGFFEGEETVATGRYEPRWTFATEDEIRGGVAAFNNKVFVGSYDSNLYALQASNGDFVWKYASTAGVATTPMVDKKTGLVFFGSEDQYMYAVDMETGRQSWSYLTQGRVRSSPTVAHDHVFFGSDDGHVYAVHASTGRHLWKYEYGAEVRVRPYVTKDLVIAASEAGDITALELSGKKKWMVDPSKRGRAILSSPVVDEKEGICYVGCHDGHLYALDIVSGYSLWRFRTSKPVFSSVAIDGTTVFFGSVEGVLYAVNTETGKEKWRYTVEKPIVASPLYHNGWVYFGDTEGIFYCLEAKSGREQWKYPTKAAITGTPFILDRLILVGSLDYSLYAFPLVG